MVRALSRKKATLTSFITMYSDESTETIQPWITRMLTWTPFLLVFFINSGNWPSLAVQSRPRLGPDIHDITPARTPKAISRLMTFVSQPTR